MHGFLKAKEDPDERMERLTDPASRFLLPGGEDAQYVADLSNQAVFVGDDQYGTTGEHNYLCCGCTRVLFRRFRPTAEQRALAWRCKCGQVNIFE